MWLHLPLSGGAHCGGSSECVGLSDYGPVGRPRSRHLALFAATYGGVVVLLRRCFCTPGRSPQWSVETGWTTGLTPRCRHPVLLQ
jgi:hypothetical protein